MRHFLKFQDKENIIQIVNKCQVLVENDKI